MECALSSVFKGHPDAIEYALKTKDLHSHAGRLNVGWKARLIKRFIEL
jgi:hypothetical protein